jgi:hypothetical protein
MFMRSVCCSALHLEVMVCAACAYCQPAGCVALIRLEVQVQVQLLQQQQQQQQQQCHEKLHQRWCTVPAVFWVPRCCTAGGRYNKPQMAHVPGYFPAPAAHTSLLALIAGSRCQPVPQARWYTTLHMTIALLSLTESSIRFGN